MVQSAGPQRIRCAECRFWQVNGASPIVGQGEQGECHRNPPTGQVAMTPQGPGALAIFPPTPADAWCGAAEPRTNT